LAVFMIEQVELTAATAAAGRNFEGNLRAVAERQPSLAQEVAEVGLDLEWVFGRDGSLTARAQGKWWSGCSLPRRTAEALLRKMELKGTVICFLSPTHAGQVRVTLERMSAGQALVAVVPDLGDLRVMLGCESFEKEIRAGRLWFASGEQWAGELARILAENEGLPTPGQFIRTGLVEKEVLEEMIRTAQEVFSCEVARRAFVVRTLIAETPVSEKIGAVLPSAFRLWEDVGAVMGQMAAAGNWQTIDPDDPCQASPVVFAQLAAGAGVVVVVNCGRAELPGELPAETRIVSWITGPRIPRFEPKGAKDVLLVADERWRTIAISMGWPAERVKLAGWPVETRQQPGQGLGVIADTMVLAMPEFGLSSQKVLWETIANELANDPFAAGLDAEAYLGRWLRQALIAEETVDHALFIDRLIVPAYQQGLVRWLMRAGVEVKLFGAGWGELEEFAQRHAGEVSDRESLRRAIEACAGLVHVWPAAWAHPIEATGRAVLKRGTRSKEMWIAEAKRLARGEGKVAVENGTVISAETMGT
jgi:hypothetical protein